MFIKVESTSICQAENIDKFEQYGGNETFPRERSRPWKSLQSEAFSSAFLEGRWLGRELNPYGLDGYRFWEGNRFQGKLILIPFPLFFRAVQLLLL